MIIFLTSVFTKSKANINKSKLKNKLKKNFIFALINKSNKIIIIFDK